MSRAYDYWIYEQLEPDDKVLTGRINRRYPTSDVFYPEPSFDPRTLHELEEMEHEFLTRHGVPCQPKTFTNG
jgi:hypothetical protein